MNLIRKYKISKLINKPLTGVETEIIDFIHEWLKDLIPFKMKAFQNSIFYMNSTGKFVLEQDNKNDRLWIRWEGFWYVLTSQYELKYTDIQILLKFMVEEAFKKELSTPLVKVQHLLLLVEEAFKKELSTPEVDFEESLVVVEEAFKQKVRTPKPDMILSGMEVEEAFKKKVSTPFINNYRNNNMVEEAFQQQVSIPTSVCEKSIEPIEEAFQKVSPPLHRSRNIDDIEEEFKKMY